MHTSSENQGAQPDNTQQVADQATPEVEIMPSLEELLKQAELQAAEHHDAWLRAKAEADNIRRRSAEEVQAAQKFAVTKFATEMLAVKDSLEMALKSDTPTIDSIREGVQTTLRQLASAFEKNQLHEIDPVGEKFDPNLHQAISTVPVSATRPPVAANHVVTVLQKGYLINDRVLRPALVMVAQG